MRKLIVALIRPRLEYAEVARCPHKKKRQKRLRKYNQDGPSMSALSCREGLEKLGLLSLEKRRERGDTIAVFRTMLGVNRSDRKHFFVWDGGAQENMKRN